MQTPRRVSVFISKLSEAASGPMDGEQSTPGRFDGSHGVPPLSSGTQFGEFTRLSSVVPRITNHKGEQFPADFGVGPPPLVA